MTDSGNIVAKVTVTVQSRTISRFNIYKGASIVIGRGNDVQYQIKSGALSRRHCQIADRGDYLELTDLGSLNGTYVNQQKVKQTRLVDRDKILLGPIILEIELRYDRPAQAKSQQQIQTSAPVYPGLASPNHTSVTEEDTIRKTVEKKGPPAFIQKNAGQPLYVKRPIFERDFKPSQCFECGKKLTAKEMACHGGIFKDGMSYCLPCFCDGSGNFPTIAGYRIVKKMGGGGMGDVYESIQLSMERPVAFKLMRGLENASEPQVRRFFREARTGGKLNHPNIVGFIDAGKLEGACFIAMEFIYGIDIRQIIDEQGPLHFTEALRIAYYVAQALDYANSRFNIVHRDVKPENILIDRDNMIKLTDFGLAKNLEEAGLSGITKSQTGVGTLFYMAPEQISDARFADHRADIYSLGVTIYEMLTATRPFVADQMMALVNKIRYEQPTAITDVIPGIPTEICSIVYKAIEKDCNRRYQSAKEMMEELQTFIQ